MSDHSDEDELAVNMKRITELMPALCSIGKDVNFELQQQAEQCARIWDKVEAARSSSDAYLGFHLGA